MAVSWAPNLLTSSPPQQQLGAAEQPGSPVLQAVAADPATAQPEPAPGVAPSVAALAPESVQLLQSMSQQIEQLKASIEELRTGQQQISRDISETRTALANPSEQNPRPVMPAHPLPPAAAPARKQRPAFMPAQAAATPMPLLLGANVAKSSPEGPVTVAQGRMPLVSDGSTVPAAPPLALLIVPE